jgi:hypothetical protein
VQCSINVKCRCKVRRMKKVMRLKFLRVCACACVCESAPYYLWLTLFHPANIHLNFFCESA